MRRRSSSSSWWWIGKVLQVTNGGKDRQVKCLLLLSLDFAYASSAASEEARGAGWRTRARLNAEIKANTRGICPS